MEKAAELKQIDQEPNLPNQPSYAFADGSLDVAYEEIAEARANCHRAFRNGLITDEQKKIVQDKIREDYKSVGCIPAEKLEELTRHYAQQNKSETYQFAGIQFSGL